MRCLVTGAAGFIGSHLSESLIAGGHSVVGIDCFTDYYPKKIKLSNMSSLRKERAFRFKEADLATASLGSLLEGVECIFHLAAQPGVRQSWGRSFSHYVRDNIVATQRLLEAAKAHQLRKFVYASSSSIYGDAEQSPTSEDVNPFPISPYGATKLAGEHLCRVYFRNYDIPLVCLRYFTVYGPRQRPDMAFSRFISLVSSGREIEVYGDGEQRRDFTFVDDIVRGNILALDANPGSTFNVGAGRTTSLNEVIGKIEKLVQRRAVIKRLPAAGGDVRSTSADIKKISMELGYEPKTSLADGLRKQVEYQLASE